jgi:hypothetical protein
MKATREFISQLLKERRSWERSFGIESSRVVYNPLIKHHLRGIKGNYPTILYGKL